MTRTGRSWFIPISFIWIPTLFTYFLSPQYYSACLIRNSVSPKENYSVFEIRINWEEPARMYAGENANKTCAANHTALGVARVWLCLHGDGHLLSLVGMLGISTAWHSTNLFPGLCKCSMYPANSKITLVWDKRAREGGREKKKERKREKRERREQMKQSDCETRGKWREERDI